MLGTLRALLWDRRKRRVNTSGNHRRVTDEFLDTIQTNHEALVELRENIPKAKASRLEKARV